MNTSRALTLATLLSLIYGCSHPIEIVGEGDVLSATGTRDCYYEYYLAGAESCSKNLVVHEYYETYYAEPKEGWKFEEWLNYKHCADTGNECAFNIPAAAVKIGWWQTMPPLVAVFAKTAPPPPEPVAIYSYELDAAGGLLNPQPLEGAHLKRKSVYFSFSGEYSKATFECCKVIGGEESHMEPETDKAAPFVLRVDAGALPEDNGLERELNAQLFDENGDFRVHVAQWTLEPLPTSPVIFDDGGVHNIDYTIAVEEVHVSNGTSLNILAGAKLRTLVNANDSDLMKPIVLNVYDGEIDSLIDGGGYDSDLDAFNIYGGSIGNIDIIGGTLGISGGTIASLTAWLPSLTISGGVIGTMAAKAVVGELTITGGTFIGSVGIRCEYTFYEIKISGGLFKEGLDIVSLGNTSLVFYGDLELVLLDRWIDEYKSFAEYSIEGSLRDGSSLSAPISCISWTPWAGEEPCPGVSISVEP